MAHAMITRRSIVNGGSVNYMTQAQWDSLSIQQKRDAGLTLIGADSDFGGLWHNYSNLNDISIDFEHPSLERMSYGNAGVDEVFTALEDGYYLVLNYEAVGEAGNTHRSGSTTSSTGLILWTDSRLSDFDYGTKSRDTSLLLSLIQLEAGDTVSLSNNHNNNWASQIHFIFKSNSNFTSSIELFKSIYYADVGSNIVTINGAINPLCIAVVIDNMPTGVQSSASISLNYSEELGHYSITSGRSSIYIGEYFADGGSSLTLTTSTNTSYDIKTFAAWTIQ